ncbi:TPA: hypothetical protein N0F65_000190 [Lagenidium giganteum]|uniref:Restriction endonuclease domain-containing protein n=1 Tax=Lagenidium giganteum TaxID=4803 RepID=A0AAV2YTE4_9STRA|nr:TPA: hypothetical protein N0F65_000190 [Lagenidium giganteum]
MVLPCENEQRSPLVSKMAAPYQKIQREVLARLVQDLKEKKSLCCVKDYTGVTLEERDRYVMQHGPIVNPVIGEQPAFFIDEGHFTPYRIVVYGSEAIAFEIAGQLRDWIQTNGGTRKKRGGRGTTSQGAYILDRRSGKPLVRMPDVAYVPRDVYRSLNHRQEWSYGGEPFAPTFVVEIAQLSGRTDSESPPSGNRLSDTTDSSSGSVQMLPDPKDRSPNAEVWIPESNSQDSSSGGDSNHAENPSSGIDSSSGATADDDDLPSANFVKLDNKMRNEYFKHGVQLGWVIDPRPGYERMYEYFLDEDGEVQRSVDTTWRDLNGRDVLPGFRVRSGTLDMVLNQESGSSEDEELNITCQNPGCGKRSRSIRENAAHDLEHLEDSALAHLEEKRARRDLCAK